MSMGGGADDSEPLTMADVGMVAYFFRLDKRPPAEPIPTPFLNELCRAHPDPQRAEPVEFLTIGPSFAIFWSALKILPFLENIGS